MKNIVVTVDATISKSFLIAVPDTAASPCEWAMEEVRRTEGNNPIHVDDLTVLDLTISAMDDSGQVWHESEQY